MLNMITDFFGRCKYILKDAFEKLKDHEKRAAMARVVEEFGYGGQSFVAKEFNTSRDTLRKGMHEIRSGIYCEDAFNMRGRKKTEERLPKLTQDIKDIAEPQCQTDPQFQSARLYTRLTICEIRKQLIEQKGYQNCELPTNQTLNTIVNNLGYLLKIVQKTKPLKKLPETDAIFDNLKKVHDEIAEDDMVVRLSIDTKDKVKIGDFSRGGKSRVKVEAADHDFGDKYVIPFGIMNVKDGTVDISISETKVTADFMMDCLEAHWIESKYQDVKKVLVLNADNGPENHSRRTQFIKRIVEFSAKYNITIHLAYYPPYHSKYNPIERVWGILEQHWNGDLLDSKATVVEFVKTMTYKGLNPSVTLIDKAYETGKKLDKKTMDLYETALERMSGIGKWFVSIYPSKCKEIVNIELLI